MTKALSIPRHYITLGAFVALLATTCGKSAPSAALRMHGEGSDNMEIEAPGTIAEEPQEDVEAHVGAFWSDLAKKVVARDCCPQGAGISIEQAFGNYILAEEQEAEVWKQQLDKLFEGIRKEISEIPGNSTKPTLRWVPCPHLARKTTLRKKLTATSALFKKNPGVLLPHLCSLLKNPDMTYLACDCLLALITGLYSLKGDTYMFVSPRLTQEALRHVPLIELHKISISNTEDKDRIQGLLANVVDKLQQEHLQGYIRFLKEKNYSSSVNQVLLIALQQKGVSDTSIIEAVEEKILQGMKANMSTEHNGGDCRGIRESCQAFLKLIDNKKVQKRMKMFQRVINICEELKKELSTKKSLLPDLFLYLNEGLKDAFFATINAMVEPTSQGTEVAETYFEALLDLYSNDDISKKHIQAMEKLIPYVSPSYAPEAVIRFGEIFDRLHRNFLREAYSAVKTKLQERAQQAREETKEPPPKRQKTS